MPVPLTCRSCVVSYCDYKLLLEHLYWRHGTESFWCNTCGLKRWLFAVHICHVLPINNDVTNDGDSDALCYSERETDFCFCGKYITEAQMIGCDGPRCVFQWYHFACVGIESPPEGDWLCPVCVTLEKAKVNEKFLCTQNCCGFYLLV